MNALNGILRSVVGGVLAPLSALPPWVGLVLISAVLGIAAAAAFRFVSNQKALKRVADDTRSNLLALWLFRHDVRASLRAQGGLLWASLRRLTHSLLPLAVLTPPFILILAHMAMWYEFRPLRPGETGLVEMRLSEEEWNRTGSGTSIELAPPAGVNVETRLRDESARSVTWRLRATPGTGGGDLLFSSAGGSPVAKKLAVAPDDRRLVFAPPARPGTSFWDRLLYPGEPAFDAGSPVQSIWLSASSRSTPIFGLDVPWWLTFFVVSIVAALLAKPLLKVQF